MACPTCDHTMQQVCDNAAETVYWCPRCGTLNKYSDFPSVEAPKLVERCRLFLKVMTAGADAAEWERIGVAEAINVPEDRPK